MDKNVMVNFILKKYCRLYDELKICMHRNVKKLTHIAPL